MSTTKKGRRPSARRPAAVSDQLRSVIESRRLTAYAVAKAAGISPSALTRFMREERGLTTQTLDLVCDVLGLELKPTRRGLGTRQGVESARVDT